MLSYYISISYLSDNLIQISDKCVNMVLGLDSSASIYCGWVRRNLCG